MDLRGSWGRPAGGVGEAALGVGLEKEEKEGGGGRGAGVGPGHWPCRASPPGASSLLLRH